jgi:uncharacterized protein (DUF58 family)
MEIRRGFWVLMCVGVGAITGILLTQDDTFYRILYLCVAILLFGWVWTSLALRDITIERTIRGQRQQLGQIFEERFEVKNKFVIGHPWLEIRDFSNLPGSNGSRILSWIGAHQARSYISYTLLTRRGEYSLGPTEIRSGDPFGIFSKKKSFSKANAILVLPYVVDIHHFPFPPGYLSGGRAQKSHSPDVTPHASGVREYSPGDTLNRIHWKSTARRDRLISKDFDKDPRADVWVILDSHSSAQASIQSLDARIKFDPLKLWHRRRTVILPQEAFEYAVSSVASVVKYFLRTGQAVGFTTQGQQMVTVIPERGDRQFNKILEALAYIRPEGDLQLFGFIQAQADQFTRGSTIVLVTSSMDTSNQMAVSWLAQRRLRPVVIFIDPTSFGKEDRSASNFLLIKQSGVPVNKISEGANLADALENGFR